MSPLDKTKQSARNPMERAALTSPPKDNLRHRAEQNLRKQRAGPLRPSREEMDLEAAWHELQVHEIELEMQNEELLRAKLEIEKSHHRYRELFESAPVGYLTLDGQGRICEANRAAGVLLGTPATGLQRSSFLRFVALGCHEGFVAFWQRVRSTKHKQACELDLISEGQTKLHVHVEGIVTPDGAEAAGQVRLILMDITERKRAEQEQQEHRALERRLLGTQKLESLGVLAGGIAHDFNNLLTGVLGNASLARKELPADSIAHPYLERILTSASRAAELCKQMLDYSGKGRFIVEPVNLNTLIADAQPLLHVSISKTSTLRFNLAAELPAIAGDATQIRQVLMNLVINASEAITGSEGSIVVNTGVVHPDRASLTSPYLSSELPEGEYVFVEVRDNGCGMTEETKVRIFDPFFTTKFTGRGLGLAAVLGIVRGHKAAVQVESEVTRGTIFRLLFPVLKGARAVAARPRAETAWQGTGRILVIDDEEGVRHVAARMVKNLGFDVLVATTGREGLELFREQGEAITAVMLDLTMPGLSGEVVFRELRRLRPDARVLLMSGFSEENATDRLCGAAASAFIQKPFKLEDLREKLRALFEPGLNPEASSP